MQIKSVVALSCFLLLVGALPAKPEKSAPDLQGSVRNQSATEISGLTVRLTLLETSDASQPPSPDTFEQVTDSEGHFTFDEVPPGTYRLDVISADGQTGLYSSVEDVDDAVQLAIEVDVPN